MLRLLSLTLTGQSNHAIGKAFECAAATHLYGVPMNITMDPFRNQMPVDIEGKYNLRYKYYPIQCKHKYVISDQMNSIRTGDNKIQFAGAIQAHKTLQYKLIMLLRKTDKRTNMPISIAEIDMSNMRHAFFGNVTEEELTDLDHFNKQSMDRLDREIVNQMRIELQDKIKYDGGLMRLAIVREKIGNPVRQRRLQCYFDLARFLDMYPERLLTVLDNC